MEKKRFRPHHIFCKRFLKVGFPDRGVEFQQVEQRLKDIIQTGGEVLVEVTESAHTTCNFPEVLYHVYIIRHNTHTNISTGGVRCQQN